jgi:hypothetical protein
VRQIELHTLEQSLAMRQQTGEIDGKAATLTHVGAMLFHQERYEDAMPLLAQAYAIFQKSARLRRKPQEVS